MVMIVEDGKDLMAVDEMGVVLAKATTVQEVLEKAHRAEERNKKWSIFKEKA